ncbi:MAG: hypothetical protein IKK29_01665 [Christensenellaceae bacterium]|nr:hypothetical protein [Christensenellaceae bacterium]
MFANQAENALSKAILEASKFYLKQFTDKLEALGEDAGEDAFITARREYLDLVSSSIINHFEKQRPDIAKRIQAAMLNPELCGYRGIDINNGISAGALYAICLYAVENRVAKSNDCIRLNREQNAIMLSALDE